MEAVACDLQAPYVLQYKILGSFNITDHQSHPQKIASNKLQLAT